MYIHVIQSGETLGRLSQQYGVSVQSIMATNTLSSTNLVPGQTLLIPIPVRPYVVMPGDTLYTIASRYRLTLSQLMAANPTLQGNAIYAGDILTLPAGASRPTKGALGFLELRSSQADEMNVYNNAPYYTYLSLFGYGMTTTGAIVPTQDEPALQAIQSINQSHALPAATFANWVNNGFSPGAVHTLFSIPGSQEQYVSEVVRIVSEKGYRAVVIDFESLNPEDRDAFVAFLAQLRSRLQPLGVSLIVCLMPITGVLPYEGVTIRAYDYTSIAQNSDYVIQMAYNWSWPGGPPGPVSSLPLVEDAINYTLRRIPRTKVLLGMIRYGYDWPLPFRTGESTRTLEVQAIVNLAIENQIAITFDRQSWTPSLRYWDSQGRQHVVWFEDARSLQMKLQLVHKYNLPGIAAWELSERFPQFTQLMMDNFRIVTLS